MKKYFVILIAIVYSINLFSWGSKGHDIVAFIAEQHLTTKTKKKLNEILDGYSLVYYSNWADNAKYNNEFRYTSTWHYLNFNDSLERNLKGDVEMAINLLVNLLKSDTLNIEQEANTIKLLIHFVGDIHCPMHLGYANDKGGNEIKVKFFNQSTNLHSVWDSQLIEKVHKWCYSEWQKEIDIKKKKEIKQIQNSKPIDWANESHQIAKEIYQSTPDGTKIYYNYLAKYSPIVEYQLLKGGYRLAAILNEIY